MLETNPKEIIKKMPVQKKGNKDKISHKEINMNKENKS